MTQQPDPSPGSPPAEQGALDLGYAPPPGYPVPAYAPPPGYGFPPPGYGYPPPGHPSYGYGYPPAGYGRPPGTNGLAIAALVLGIAFAPLGLVFGLVALGQIKRTGQDGRGLALAGAIVGGIFTLIFVLEIVFFVTVASTLA